MIGIERKLFPELPNIDHALWLANGLQPGASQRMFEYHNGNRLHNSSVIPDGLRPASKIHTRGKKINTILTKNEEHNM